jgi:hypothetical protein
VATKFKAGEEFVITAGRQDGSLQFDFVKIKEARLTREGVIGLSFDPIDHKGVQPEVAFASEYEGGAFTMRPVSVKRYFVDKSDKEHPSFSMSVDGGDAIPISRNVVAFQLRYLELKEGEVEAAWVNEQSLSREFKTVAVEVTATARTEVSKENQSGRLVTLASVIRPRDPASGDFGSSPGKGSTGIPSDGWDDPGGNGSGGPGGPGGTGPGTTDIGLGGGSGSGNGREVGPGFGTGGYRHESRRIGKSPKLRERLNPRR